MRMFQGLEISGMGMKAERQRMDLISLNVANVHSVETPDAPLYRAKRLMTTAGNPMFNNMLSGIRRSEDLGVRIQGVVENNGEGRRVYEPGNPYADEAGYVTYPDINILEEMVAAITASRAYEANVTTFNETKKMMNKALDIGKGL